MAGGDAGRFQPRMDPSGSLVLMFGVRDSGFVISVFANGVAQIPSEAKPKATRFYVEISMIAEMNTVDGGSAAHFPRLGSLMPTQRRLRTGQLLCAHDKCGRLRIHGRWGE
ncbi:MAG: hypothetical protein Q9210_001151 [Variospora velana]